jgi:ankyrin repeat protein
MNRSQRKRPERTLPVRANLEHLRNEAKQLRKEMRLKDPDTTLSAAQLLVARRYGFANWRRLKACVEGLHDSGARLLTAVRTGDLDTVRAVLDRDPELVNAATDLAEHRLRPSDTGAMRLIHLAVAENQPEAVRFLLERGADPNVRNQDGRLPMHDCFELGRDSIAKLLLENGAEPDVCAAAAYGLHDRLVRILEQDAQQANDLRTGITPLGWSVYGRQPESARILIDRGAIVNRPPFDANTWAAAAHVANTNVTPVLLDRGADPNCRLQNGDTPMHAALRSRLVRDPTAFIELLLGAGADPELRNDAGRTVLDEALLQTDRTAETYFPARPAGSKNINPVIEMLQARRRG